MDMMTNRLETSLAKCKWCEREFKTERTLAAHLCVKKRRWADRDMTHIRLGYRVFQMFYELNTAASKPKSMEDFIKSQYYEGFTKFGRACVRNEYMQPEQFAEWLIRKGKKLSDWTKDAIYDEYLLEYVKREPGLKALERTVRYLNEWSTESGVEWSKYFCEVSANRAVYDLRSAKVSPWVLYLSDTGDQLLTRLNAEQVKMINHIIDANFWMNLFSTDAEQVDEVRAMCEAANL